MEGGRRRTRRRTRHRRHPRRGGMSTDAENKFLEQKRRERKESLDNVGENARKAPDVFESIGTATKQPNRNLFQERQTELAKAEHDGKDPPKAGRRRRSHKRKHTRRRR